LQATVGIALGFLRVLCAVLGLYLINGVSIEFPGIILGGLGYYFGLQGGNRTGQTLGIVAVVLSVISILISGLFGGPQ
jgi:uncharacterized RDD family membrane protein YckC